jgi:hypothetical protein
VDRARGGTARGGLPFAVLMKEVCLDLRSPTHSDPYYSPLLALSQSGLQCSTQLMLELGRRIPRIVIGASKFPLLFLCKTHTLSLHGDHKRQEARRSRHRKFIEINSRRKASTTIISSHTRSPHWLAQPAQRRKERVGMRQPIIHCDLIPEQPLQGPAIRGRASLPCTARTSKPCFNLTPMRTEYLGFRFM